MKTLIKSTAFAVCMFSIGLSAPVTSVSAATYYACTSGYEFQVNNNAARCYRAPKTVYKALLKCPKVFIPLINKEIGHFFKKNYQGNKDMCVGTFKVGPVTNTNAVETACPSGYSKHIKSGTDNCHRTIPASTKKPDRSVNR